MRFMILLKADRNTEAGVMPSEQLLAAMGKYNEE
ncbi:MAG: YciI family protein, partial [Gemmatimonadales bacterium]